MAIENGKLFKGILQVTALPETPEKGYIYLVGNGGKGGKGTGIYFGSRWYGKTLEDAEVKVLIERLSTAEGDIATIKEQIGEWVADMGTIASVVAAHETAITANASAITAEENARKEAISALTDVVNTKAAQTALTAEENARKEAISALTDDMNGKFALKADQTALTAETKARQDAVSDLYTAIGEAQGAAVQEATAYTESEIEKIVSAYTKADKEMSNKIQDLEKSIGENGDTAKAIKAAQDAADAAQADVDALSEVVGDGFNKDSTVTAQLAAVKATADAAAKNADFTAHTANTDVHVSAELQGKWNKAAADIDAFLGAAVNDQEAVIDTLKEIQDFLTSDDGTVKKLLDDVATNASAITAEENARKAAISALTDDMNEKFDLKADQTALTAETKARQDAISALTDVVNTKAAQADLLKVSGDVATNASAITAEENARKEAIAALNAVVSGSGEGVIVTVTEVGGLITNVSVNDSTMKGFINEAQGAAQAYTDTREAAIMEAVNAIDHRVYYGGDDAE